MKRPYLKTLLGVAAIFGLTTLATERASALDVVYCHDPARDIVTRTAAYDCKGKIVSEREAEAITERRARYIRNAVRNPPPPRPTGVGSGFFVSSHGHILTNRHVAAGCKRLSVLLPNGETVPAKVASLSSLYDIALLQTSAKSAAMARLSAEPLVEGQRVTITGFPVRKLPRVRPLKIQGAYLGRHESNAAQGMLVLAASILRGASGSPVVTPGGSVVGMVFARSNKTGQPAETPDRTFAVPARAILTFLENRGINASRQGKNPADPERFTVRVNCNS